MTLLTPLNCEGIKGSVVSEFQSLSKMSDHSCSHCSRVFSSSSNRLRHERLFHGAEEEDISDYHENDDDPETDDEETEDLWPEIIKNAYSEFKKVAKAPLSLILVEPYLSQFIENVKDYVEKRIRFNDVMQQDEHYKKIADLIDTYKEEDFDKDEAIDAAWHKRRFLVRKIVKGYIDTLHDDDSEDEDEEESMEKY